MPNPAYREYALRNTTKRLGGDDFHKIMSKIGRPTSKLNINEFFPNDIILALFYYEGVQMAGFICINCATRRFLILI